MAVRTDQLYVYRDHRIHNKLNLWLLVSAHEYLRQILAVGESLHEMEDVK
jgi:hypothetical protein